MAYSLATSYAGESLLSGFNWFNGEDPSHGYVSYQSRDDAEAKGLFSINDEVVRLGVDHTNTYGLDEGRPSIRLESKEAYNHGLFIADFSHMPPSQCGLWPAFWSYGSDWPSGGEMDIIEGANTAHQNIISGHTADGCMQDASTDHFTGEQRNTECAIGEYNIGCGYDPPADDASSYGDGFNAVGGGVYAMQWNDEHIRVWHFARGAVPADIGAKTPDPEAWGLPQAVFGGSSCDVDSYWKNMSLVININFCGDYGNALWGQADTCTDFAPTCAEYVANNPEAFTNAYWDVNYIDAYQFDPSAPTHTAEPTTTTTMTSFSTTTLTVGGTPTTPANGADVTPTAAPLATAAPANPGQIGDFSYLGCFGSSSGFQTFDQAEQSEDMTLDQCVKQCDGKKYAGVFESTCYCADSLDADTRASASNDQCDHPCPGNTAEFCGGLLPAAGNSTVPTPSRRRRANLPNMTLLTVYGAVADDTPPQPPAMATGLDMAPLVVKTTTVCPSTLPTGAVVGGNGTIVPAVVQGRASANSLDWSVVYGAMVVAVALVM